MCGIIGYIGGADAPPILIDGLRRLEYRGYDSAGIAVLGADNDIHVSRAVGKLIHLENELREAPLAGKVGIGHTRWATHGRPSEENAHPHRSGDIVVVHNGIIENHLQLKRDLEARGRVFASETDTEIFSHLIEEARANTPETSLLEAVRQVLGQIRGAYAIAVLDRANPDRLIAAKNSSPLVLGLGEGEAFIASDIPAILSHTRDVIFLNEGEMAEVRADGVDVVTITDGAPAPFETTRVNWTPAMAEKGGYKHFMLKEIHEQPRAVVDTIRGRVSTEQARVFLDQADIPHDFAEQINRVLVIACGTSWHAGLVGEYAIEELARVPVEVDLASEFRYRNPIIDDDTLVIAISQSGETADTLAALRLARERGAKVLSICNVVGSSIARESDYVLYTHAGPEIGVASTKAFTTQLTALYLLAIHLGIERGKLDAKAAGELIQELMEIPHHMEAHLQDTSVYQELARTWMHATSMLFLGRGIQFPIALEGALKLKEISYIHAEGYAAGEMKHGPIALIDENVPSMFLVPRDRHFEKVLNNVAEIRSRSGAVIAVGTVGDEEISEHVDHLITVPAVSEIFLPLLTSLPMQLFAYHVADLKGTDVDQPRNLAKSVTVE